MFKQLKTKEFWSAALARALRSFLQGILTIYTVGVAIDIATLKNALLTGAGYAIISILTSVCAGLPEVNEDA